MMIMLMMLIKMTFHMNVISVAKVFLQKNNCEGTWAKYITIIHSSVLFATKDTFFSKS